MDDETSALIPLKDAGDLEIADNESDVRGWPVFDRDGERIGRVQELLVDPGAMEVRELEVGVDEDALGLDAANRHLLVRLGEAQLDRERQRVILARASRGDISGLIRSQGDATAEQPGRERRDRRVDVPTAHGETALAQAGDDVAREARIPRVEEELDVQRRLEDAGEVQVHKRVDTEHVARDIDASREDYDVQRLPAQEVNASAPAEGEIRIPIVEEEIVVEKRPVVREVLVLRKRVLTETRRVEADLRKERVQVERRGRTGAAGEETAPGTDQPSDYDNDT